MRAALVLAAAALLAACGQGDNPGGLSDEDNQELNEAAEMLDSAETLPGEAELGNAEMGELPVTAEPATGNPGS